MKPSVFVAIFSGTERHNWLCPEFAQFFAALTLEQRAVTVHTQHETRPIDYARNLAVRAFLASGLDWLLMADNDMGLPSNLLKLLDWAPANADVVVPRFYRAMSLANGGVGVQRCWELLESAKDEPWPELIAGGTGCMAIRRSVFQRVRPPWFRFAYAEDGRITKGEDISFCERTRAAGCRIFGCQSITVQHYHTVGLASLAASK
jgi:GT2 family glycosyltransferase